MTKNLGGFDRALRFLLAFGIALMWYRGAISGTIAIVLGIFALAFLVTSILGWCPLYVPFGWSTRRQTPGTVS